MNTTKKQWIAPEISEMEIEDTTKAPGRPSEGETPAS